LPTRYLKPGIRDSESIDSLSPMTETLFYRLLVTVDDFGRADARPAMVKALCFPIKESVTAAKCAQMLAELVSNGLAAVYVADGKTVLQMLKWDNKPRASASLFPDQSDECIQAYTDVCKPRTLLPVTVTVTGTETVGSETPIATHEGFARFWSAYPKKAAKPAAIKAFKAQKVNGEIGNILDDIARKAASDDWTKDGGKYVPNPATYLNQRRWEDEAAEPRASQFAGAI